MGVDTGDAGSQAEEGEEHDDGDDEPTTQWLKDSWVNTIHKFEDKANQPNMYHRYDDYIYSVVSCEAWRNAVEETLQ